MDNFFVISIDEDIIQIYNDKNIEFFSKDLVDLSLKVCQGVCQSEKYHLVFKLAITSLETHLLFVLFPNSHSIIYTGKVELDEPFNSIQPVYQLPNKR